MSDFFARLASRAADLPVPTPAVRPRLPHLFERPQPISAQPPNVEEFRWHTSEPSPTTERGTEHGRTPAPQPPTLATRAAAMPEPHVDDVVRRRTVTNVESVSSVRQVVERLQLARSPALVPPPVVAPTRIAPDVQPVDQPRAAASPPPVRAAEPLRRNTTMPGERADLAAARRRAPEPERVVHISIGRLEVVGNRPAPSKSSSRTDRPAPLLPLNDYLTGEGGRG